MSETPRPVRAPNEPGYLRPGGNREVRRRRQRRTASRAILWCSLWLAGLAAATFGFRSAWQLLKDPERFPLEHVIVEGAGERVNHEVESSLAPLLGRNVLTVDLGEVERSAMRSPWVRSASVKLRLPSALLVILEPRAVAALVLAGDGVHIVDASGSDIGRYTPSDSGENHPVITGVMEPGGRASAARLASGIQAARRLSEGSPEFAAVRRRIEAEELEAEYIDLRFKDRIAVMPTQTGAGASGT